MHVFPSQHENNDHCPFEIGSQIVMLRWWWSGMLMVKKLKMVESALSEGGLLENWFTVIKPCFIKHSKPLFFFQSIS